MTNRDKFLQDLASDINMLATALIVTRVVDNGDYFYDGEDEYWVDSYTEQYESPSGRTYADYDYDECLKDTIEWLEKESK